MENFCAKILVSERFCFQEGIAWMANYDKVKRVDQYFEMGGSTTKYYMTFLCTATIPVNQNDLSLVGHLWQSLKYLKPFLEFSWILPQAPAKVLDNSKGTKVCQVNTCLNQTKSVVWHKLVSQFWAVPTYIYISYISYIHIHIHIYNTSRI